MFKKVVQAVRGTNSLGAGGKLGIWEAWEKAVTLSSSEIMMKT